MPHLTKINNVNWHTYNRVLKCHICQCFIRFSIEDNDDLNAKQIQKRWPIPISNA